MILEFSVSGHNALLGKRWTMAYNLRLLCKFLMNPQRRGWDCQNEMSINANKAVNKKCQGSCQ